MTPPGNEQHNCERCGQALRYIEDYGAWFCYVCQTYETPEVQQMNVCSTCNQPLTYLEPYSAWYCYTCQKYQVPEEAAGAYSDTTQGYQEVNCPNCGHDMSSGQCYYCLADDMMAAAQTSIDSARKIGASVGKVEEKLNQAKRMVSEDRPEMAIEVAEEAEEAAKSIRQKHKRAKKMMTTLEDDLDKLAQFDINTSTADNQMQLARNFMRSGNYEKTLDFLKKAQEFTDNAARKAGIKPRKTTVTRPRYSTDYPACPDCGNPVKKADEICPVCDSPLYEEVPIEEADKEEVVTEEKAAGPSFGTAGLGGLISEKDVGKVAPVEGSEVKPQIPGQATKPAPPPTVGAGKCPSCGEDVEDDWAKCPFCSTVIKAPPAKPGPTPEVAKPPEPAPPPPKPEKPPAVEIKCHSCGSDIETGWKRCPVCMSPVKPLEPKPAPVTAGPEPKPPVVQPTGPPKPAPPPPKPTVAAKDAPLPPPPPPPPKGGASKEGAVAEIADLSEMVKGLDSTGVNTAHVKNLIRLAQSFLKGGAIDKAQRYIRKARQATTELKNE